MKWFAFTFKARLILVAFPLIVAVGGWIPSTSYSADDNMGVEFVLGFEANHATRGNQTLFITSDVATSGTVTAPGLVPPFSASFTVTPGTITSVSVPLSAQVTSNDVVGTKGMLVEALDEIAVYGLNQERSTTDAFLGLPTDILGTEHFILSFDTTISFAPSQFMIVGTVDGTTVTITPSVTTGTRTAGVPYTITLNRLDTYQLQTNEVVGDDLSGSLITSDHPVTVFGGVQCADVPAGVFACDHIVEPLLSKINPVCHIASHETGVLDG